MTRSVGGGEVGSGGAGLLSIGDVAGRTGLTVAALRNWESRYGVPAPIRTAGGQRRYRESDCRLIADILRRRAAGVSLAAAVEQGRRAATAPPPENSIYRSVRDNHPHLPVHRMAKSLLLALTFAIEDECCVTARRPLLLGAFQEARFYESARQRWRSMAATGLGTVVFADFDRARTDRPPVRRPPPRNPRPRAGSRPPRSGQLLEVPIPPDSPLRREWALICDNPELPACVLGWEPPGQESRPDRSRVFEVVWSVEPPVVRQAARAGVEIASSSFPDLATDLAERLDTATPPVSPDLRRAAGLLERTVDYVAGRRRY